MCYRRSGCAAARLRILSACDRPRDGAGDDCVGTGIVVTAQDGTKIGEFDRGACPRTTLLVHKDGTVTVYDAGKQRSPATP